MKIVCDACSAKYSIADEKVRGKVFKIRCKKCGNVIVVRGAPGNGEPIRGESFDQKETRVFDYPEQAQQGEAAFIWHLVIDQEQVGPMAADEVRQRWARGEIDGDSYVWREGFADWQTLASVDTFADLAGSAYPTAAAGYRRPGHAGSGTDDAAMFGGPAIEDTEAARSDPADLFAAAGGEPTAASDPDDAVFAGAGAAPAYEAPASLDRDRSMADSLFGGNGAGTAVDSAGRAGQPQLRGQRNENSVLFSLTNLAALATPEKAPPGAGGPVSQPGMAQPGGGEGSGLIDIRSMASAYLGSKGHAAGAGAEVDDLPVFGQTSFDQPASVLLPTTTVAESSNKLLYALMAIIAVLALAAVALVIVVLKTGPAGRGAHLAAATPEQETKPPPSSHPKDEEPAGPPSRSQHHSRAPAATIPSQDRAEPPAAPSWGEKAAPAPQAGDPGSGEQAGGEGDGDGEASGSSRSERSRSERSRSERAQSSSRSERRRQREESRHESPRERHSESEEERSSSGSCLDEVACLLADNPPACCARYSQHGGSSSSSSSRRARREPSSDLPETLSRSDIADGIGAVRGSVRSCSGSGKVTVRVTVAPSGAVSDVAVQSATSSDLARCVVGRVKRARFIKTQNGRTFTYPFLL